MTVVSTPFPNRAVAGQLLAKALSAHASQDVVVLGLARGGVPVARVVARALGAPLGVLTTLKLWVPGQPEHAAGAVAPGVRFILDEVVRELEISTRYLTIAAGALEAELDQRAVLYPALPPLAGCTVVIVDDGVASGATAAAAIESVRASGARRVIFAAPVGCRSAIDAVQRADDMVVPVVPESFRVVSDFYVDFSPVADDEVRRLIAQPL